MRGLEKILLVTIGGVIIYLLWPKKAQAEEITIKIPKWEPELWEIPREPTLSWAWESIIKTDGQQAPSKQCPSGILFIRQPLPGEWCYRAL